MEETQVPANAREKYWNELTDQEKIERSRMQIKMLELRIDDLLDTIRRLKVHTHDSEGHAVTVDRIGSGLDINANKYPMRRIETDENRYF